MTPLGTVQSYHPHNYSHRLLQTTARREQRIEGTSITVSTSPEKAYARGRRYETNPFRFAGPILPQRRVAEQGRVDDYDRCTSLAAGSRWYNR